MAIVQGCNHFHTTLPTMNIKPTKDEILTAVAVEFRDDLPFLEELNSLSWSLKVRLKANLKNQHEPRLD